MTNIDTSTYIKAIALFWSLVLVFVSLVLSLPADAADLEIGAGLTSYQAQHDGAWYQDGLPHWFDLESESLSVGISQQIGKYHYRAAFVALGQMYNMAQVVGDHRYAPGMHDGGQYVWVQGRGSVSGVELAVQRPFKVLGIPMFSEAGIYAYKNKFQVAVLDADGNVVADFARKDVVLYRPMVGLGVRYEGIEFGVRYYYLDVSSEGDAVTPLQTGALNFMVKAVF